jgi:hypothetical protein
MRALVVSLVGSLLAVSTMLVACSRSSTRGTPVTIAADDTTKSDVGADAPSVPPSISVSISSTPSPAPSFVPKKELEKNLATARKLTPESLYGGAIILSCGLAGTYKSDPFDAAVLRYQCTGALQHDHDMEGVDMACMGCVHEGVRLVGGAPGNVIDEPEVGFVEVLWSSKSGVWDLKGDALRYAVTVATSCSGWDCSSEQHVYVLEDHVFSKDTSTKLSWPLVPLGGELDIDKDSHPELVARLWSVPLDAKSIDVCPPKDRRGVRVSPGGDNRKTLTIDGLISWVPTGFSTTLALFKPWYETRLRLARAAAAAGFPDDPCPLPALRTAAEVYVYARELGVSDVDAAKEADLVAGTDASWPAMRSALATQVYAALVDSR